MLLSAAVVALVLGLLLYVIVRFNKRANPTPARFTHNTPIEIIWTLIPVLILVVLGAFSLPILFKFIPAELAPSAPITNPWACCYPIKTC